MYASLYRYAPLYAGFFRIQKRESDILEMEVQTIVSDLTWDPN